jgi:hypothetical protein
MRVVTNQIKKESVFFTAGFILPVGILLDEDGLGIGSIIIDNLIIGNIVFNDSRLIVNKDIPF